MFSLFVFRRFGLSVPITLMIVGFVINMILDNKYGNGYYNNKIWPLGLTLLLTGIITGIISCIVDGPSSDSSSVFSRSGTYSLLDLEDIGEKIGDAGSSLRDTAENYIYGTSEESTFCYVPLNRCSMGLIACGLIIIIISH